MGQGQYWFNKPVTTSLFGVGEYRQGAGGIERGVEKFGSSLLSPLSLGLMVATAGLGGVAEAGAESAGTQALSYSGQAGKALLSRLAPDVAAKVATSAGTISKLASAGFTAQQILGVLERVPQFAEAVKEGDTDKALEYGTSALLEGVTAKMSLSHLMHAMSPTGEPVWTGDKEVLGAAQQVERIRNAQAHDFRKANEELIHNKPLDMAARFYHEAGADTDVLEKWRQEIADSNTIKPEIQAKYESILKQAQNLPDEVKALSSQLRLDYAQDLDSLKAAGRFHPNSPGAPNYAGQHTYNLEDEGASSLRNVGTRKFTKNPAFLKSRSYDTIVDALKEGYEPKEVGLAGAREQYMRDISLPLGAVAAEREGYKQKADDARPAFVDPAKVRDIGGKRVIPVNSGDEVGPIGERRTDTETRKSINQMSPDDMRHALLTSEVTGLPNKRAFYEAGPANAYAMSDADGLKAFNDTFGYDAGDELLRAKADALRQAGVEAYHQKGDEFLYRGDNRPDLTAKLEQARQILQNKLIKATMPDGTVKYYKGADFSYGTGLKLEDAESGLKRDKTVRESQGLRARGQLRGITEVTQGNQGGIPPQPKIITLPTSDVRPEDAIRRAIGTLDPQAVKAAILKEGASDLEIQNLRDAIKSGAVKPQPVEITVAPDGRIVDSDNLHQAYAAHLAGVEKVPVTVRRLTEDVPADAQGLREVTGKWPNGLNPKTDKEIIGRAIADVTGKGDSDFDALDKKTQRKVINRALDMKSAEKTANAPGPTAPRDPTLYSKGNVKVLAHEGKLYYDIGDYGQGPKTFDGYRLKAVDKYGKPVYERAPVLVHPDFKDPVQRAFDDSSWFRKNPLTRALLGASSQAKRSLLSLSPFHFTTEYLRGIQMGLGPREAFSPPELTADHPAVQSKFGPQFSVQNERSLAAEGAATNNSLIHKVPGVGKLMSNVEEKLFGGGGYIDRLKAASWEKVVDQIQKRHPNWNTDQVDMASSKIVDAAFGGLNWKMLGASMNGVDALRLIALAPDFTGSQLLFAYHGLQPGGSIVGQSLMRIALYNFGVSRIANMMTTGSPQLQHPFSVVSPDGKSLYSIRTMPADIAHAMTDPRQFVYNRLNPLLARSAIEGLTGRDEQGKRVTYEKELHDLLRNVTPISGQNFVPGFRREGEGIGTSVMRGLGVSVEPGTSPALKMANQLAADRSESGPVDEDKLDRHRFVIQMEDALRSGTLKPQALNEAIQHETLSRDEVKQIWNNYKETSQGADGKPMNEFTARLYTRSSRLPMKDFLQVYDAATPTERKVMQPLMEKKGKQYLKKAQSDMVAGERQKDPTYQRLWRDLAHVPLW